MRSDRPQDAPGAFGVGRSSDSTRSTERQSERSGDRPGERSDSKPNQNERPPLEDRGNTGPGADKLEKGTRLEDRGGSSGRIVQEHSQLKDMPGPKPKSPEEKFKDDQDAAAEAKRKAENEELQAKLRAMASKRI